MSSCKRTLVTVIARIWSPMLDGFCYLKAWSHHLMPRAFLKLLNSYPLLYQGSWNFLTQAKGTSSSAEAWGSVAACKHRSPWAGPWRIVTAVHCFAKTFASSVQLSWAPLKLSAHPREVSSFLHTLVYYIHNREFQIRWGMGLIHFSEMPLKLTRCTNSGLLFGWKQLIHPILTFSAVLMLCVTGGVLVPGSGQASCPQSWATVGLHWGFPWCWMLGEATPLTHRPQLLALAVWC